MLSQKSQNQSQSQRARACQNCSRRKKRCSGTKPQCHLCIQAGTDCVYPSFTLKPGPRKGFKREASTRDKSKETQPSREAQTSSSTLDNSEWETSWPSNISEQVGWSQSSVFVDAFPPFLSLENTLDVTRLASTIGQMPSQLPWSNCSGEDDVLPPKPLIILLVEVFFDYVQPQINLLHQPSFVDWIESGSYAVDEHATLILSSMFSLAARYSDHPEVDLFDRMLLRQATGNYDTRDDAYYKSRKRWERGKGFLSQAYRLLMCETSRMDKLELESGEMQRPSVTVVQAAAIANYAQMGIGMSSRAYALLSTTVQLAYDCGLDQVDCDEEVALTPRASDSDALRSIWIKKEELRRAWWVVAYLENFICVTKARPRMIDWGKCKTKLPCDDKDWFLGRQCLSDFLPSNIDDLRASLAVQPQLSVLAYRIMAIHLGARLLEAAMNDENVLESNDILSKVEECATHYKRNMPIESKTEDAGQAKVPVDHFQLRLLLESLFALSNKFRGFKHTTPSDIYIYCRDLPRQRRQGNYNDASPGAKAFSSALSASEAICSILCHSTAEDVARSFPTLAYSLWAPACLQLLVKLFARADPELADKASLYLQILTMTLERFAEYSGLGQFALSSFRRYEQRLTDLQSADSKSDHDDHWIVSRVLCFPGHINASFLREATSTDQTGAPIDPAVILDQPFSTDFLIQDGMDDFDYITRDPDWL